MQLHLHSICAIRDISINNVGDPLRANALVLLQTLSSSTQVMQDLTQVFLENKNPSLLERGLKGENFLQPKMYNSHLSTQPSSHKEKLSFRVLEEIFSKLVEQSWIGS